MIAIQAGDDRPVLLSHIDTGTGKKLPGSAQFRHCGCRGMPTAPHLALFATRALPVTAGRARGCCSSEE